jgi:hypothetical protein
MLLPKGCGRIRTGSRNSRVGPILIQTTSAEHVAITAEEVQAFGVELMKRLHIETLIHGNSTAAVSSPVSAQEDDD